MNVFSSNRPLLPLLIISPAGVSVSIPSRYVNKKQPSVPDFAAPTAVDSKHTPNVYKKKDRRMPTKRFVTASSDDEEEEEVGLRGHEVSTTGEMLRESHMNNVSELSISLPPPTQTQTNANNNNGGTSSLSPGPGSNQYEAMSSSHNDDVVDIHESLYDLVGRINAESDSKESTPPIDTPSKKVTSANEEAATNEVTDPSQGCLYEEFEDTPVISAPALKSNLPSASNAPGFQNQPSVMYDEIGPTSTDAGGLDFYEVVDSTANDNRVSSDVSDEEEYLSAAPPALPARNKLTKPPEDGPEEYYGNAPPLPPKSDSGSSSNLLSLSMPSTPSHQVAPENTAPPTDPSEVYDDVFSVMPRQNNSSEDKTGSGTSQAANSPTPKPRRCRGDTGTAQPQDDHTTDDNIYDNREIMLSETSIQHQSKPMSYPEYPKPLPRPAHKPHKSSSIKEANSSSATSSIISSNADSPSESCIIILYFLWSTSHLYNLATFLSPKIANLIQSGLYNQVASVSRLERFYCIGKICHLHGLCTIL